MPYARAVSGVLQAGSDRAAPKFRVDLFTESDLPLVEWAGGPNHAQYVAAALDRGDEVEYLAVRDREMLPVAIGGIDYARYPDAAVFWQLCTQHELRSNGLGTLLIEEMERRALARGVHVAILGVEDGNDRARALYERLGYWAFRRVPDRWEVIGDDGTIKLHETVLTELRKELRS